MELFSLEGRVALVTGAAYGIGLAIAQALAEAGARIVFNCSRQETVDRGMKAYKELGIDAKGYLCDVSDEIAVKSMVADIERTIGTIDILVNNAGIIKRVPMTQMDVEEFRQVVNVDLVGPFICAKAVIPGMIRKGHGKIINICSMMSEL
ncbi:MAG: SDR family NAD(P)-dependent oxidoreductase, partial [Muribaculaceae bacterium]|nr:SDR family NAD(P)-dependent oxidoreductase [Muribaculaceae bacterium]